MKNNKDKNNKNKNNNDKKKNDQNNKKSSMFDSLKNSLDQKYQGSQNQQDVDKQESIDNTKNKVEEVTPISCLADEIGWNNWKILLRNFCYGIFMGISDGIPGYSGGTTLSIIGFYQSLISNIKLIFKPDVKRYFWKYLLWFLPFLIAWIGIFIGFSQIVNLASDNEKGIVLVFLFGFFALFAIPIFYLKNKKDLINFKSLGTNLKEKDRSVIIQLILFILGFVLLLTFALLARFLSTSYDLNNNAIHGVTFLGSGKFEPSTAGNEKVMLWLFFGFLAGFCFLIPGVSGSLVLYMGNIYPDVNYAIAHAFTNANFIPWIIFIGLGIVLGVIFSSFVINWLLQRFQKYFQAFAFGLVVCSFVSIFVSLSNNDWQTLSNQLTLGLSIGMIFVAIIINVIIFIVLNETHKIDYPKLRFLQKLFKSKTIN